MAGDSTDKPETAAVTVQGVGTFTVPTGFNLRETLRREGIYLDGTCADRGTCGRCIVQVTEGKTQPPSEQERGILEGRGTGPDERLACRITVTGNIRIAVSVERILEIDKSGRWKAVWDSPLWSLDTYSPSRSGFGIAVDLGTTSIAAVLYDLKTGRPLDIRSASNPQRPWGDEIISRLAAARNPETAGNLRDTLWSRMEEVLRKLCLRSGVPPGRVSRMVVVCNSAMHHLALGLPVESLLSPPYDPIDRQEREIPANQPPARLRIATGGSIYFPPLAGGYAGSDAIVSAMAAVSRGAEKGALLDVGTNTEIVVWDRSRCMIATSPSGPAFEGGHLRSGMQAEEGAIWKVRVGADDLGFEVIGGGPPKGICGTGIVDLVAGMLENSLIDHTGLMQKGSHPHMTEQGFYLDRPGSVAVEPKDVAEVQKAKGAIAATLEILLSRMGMVPDDLERVYLAGAFGSHLNVDNAVSVGLVPRLEKNRYVLAGNAALVGASLVLISGKAQVEARRFSNDVQHVSVAEDDLFEQRFLENLYFRTTDR